MWPRLRGSWALAPQATCFDPTVYRYIHFFYQVYLDFVFAS